MRRARFVAFWASCGLAGALGAVVLATSPVAGADDGTTGTPVTAPAATTDTITDSTTAPVTTSAPVAATPKPKPRPPAGPKLIQAGVRVGGVLVGGLTAVEARELLQQRFHTPVTLVVSETRRVRVEPTELGAAQLLGSAVNLAARVRQEGFLVPLKVAVPQTKLQRFVAALAAATHRDPIDSKVVLRNFKPFATKSVFGRRLKEIVALREIRLALKTHTREPIVLPFEKLRPQVTESDLAHAIVIRRGSNRLLLYNGTKLQRAFRVATGQSVYPTPLGHFEIINKWANPWWYPPAGSAWAAGEKPIPPGPSNPLGTRWMGLSSPNVGIHGTPNAASIGYSASHGCIRMYIPDAEWLFNHVDIGTPVFIVSV